MKYHPDTNRITDIDAGNCDVIRGIPYGGTPEEIIRNGYLFAAAEDLQKALEDARHTLTTLHGLSATDDLSAFWDWGDGDLVAGWELFVEHSVFSIDNSAIIERIDNALAKAKEGQQ